MVKKLTQAMVLMVVLLLVNLPLVSAIQISNVNAINIQPNSATITWQTDETADSFVNYGIDKQNLQSVGDARPVTVHNLPVDGLTPSTKYYYKVKSNELSDDNNGALHSFTTLAPDTTPPILKVELPESIAGKILEVRGDTEPGVTVNVHVNSALRGSSTAREDGSFQVLGVSLEENKENLVIVSATDNAGNVVSVEGKIFTDTLAPVVTLTDLPKVVTEKSVKIIGTISEESSYQIYLDNKSVAKGKGLKIDESIRLEDGKNFLKLTATDNSGLDSNTLFEIFADTQNQFVRSDIDKGNEYYEGRAQSSISGETKPFSKVYLYVYRPLSYDYKPDFSKAREVVTADENGEFTFTNVNFASSILDLDLENLAPKVVPSGLEDQSIFSVQQVEQQQKFTYFIYLISEDSIGRTAFSQHQVSVNSCLSGNLDFSIQSLPEFQRPYVLNPKLLDSGREEVQAVFELAYQGSGQPGDVSATSRNNYHPGGVSVSGSSGYTPSQTYTSSQNLIEIEQGFRVVGNPRFEKACTQEMLKGDDRVAVGCRIFPRGPSSVTKSSDGTKYYVTWKLGSSKELSKAEEDFWNEFKKRQIVMPLKIIVNYQEREGSNQWSQSKVQTSCYDLGYSVDIPIDSKDLIPDFLANEGVDALNWTITQLNEVLPVIETVYKVTAIVSFASAGLLTVARLYRISSSKIEPILTKVKTVAGAVADDNSPSTSCPFLPEQGNLFLESTIDNWCDLLKNVDNHDKIPTKVKTVCNAGGAKSDAAKEILLEEKCPSTAGAWKLEAGIKVAFDWSFDRAFCRSVPAGWTDDEDLTKIGTAIVKQQQCAVTGRGVPLIEIENCQERLRTQLVNSIQQKVNVGTCWQAPSGTLYHYVRPQNQQSPVGAITCPAGYKYYQGGDCCEDKKNESGEEKPDGICDNTNQLQQGIQQNNVASLTQDERAGIYRLTPIQDILGRPGNPAETLLAYKPEGSDQYIIGRDQTCEQICQNPRRKDQYFADKKTNGGDGRGDENGCYTEKVDGSNVILLDGSGKKLGEEAKEGDVARGDRYAAGYTRDCFIDGYSGPGTSFEHTDGKPVFQQCVCVGQREEESNVKGGDFNYPRSAVKRVDDVKEIYSYRQDRLFQELRGVAGTHYPKERYYTGRDVSGAFGADYLLDYINDENEKAIPRVDPHNQLIGTFQSVCLSGIYKNLKMFESMLVGVRNCIVQAKTTGIQDAGACKTLLEQNVCGLLYKGIAYLSNQCSPLNFDDTEKKGDVTSITQIASKGLQSIPEALDLTIGDIQDTYGNAKLNEYFRQGSQGVAQSICMAAIGLEFPLISDDFLLDAALSFPTKSWVVMAPRERQLATFNPAKQTAIFNYELGGLIMPGCKIRNYRVSLKCIGPEDIGKEGVDTTCGGKGCDCLNVQGQATGIDGLKERLIMSDSNVPIAQMLSIPLESPIRIDSPYRYDHVKVELFLDPSEKGNEDKCFEPGYWDGSKAVFHEPLVDTSAPGEFSCQASLVTGQYTCPKLAGLFGFGGAYMSEPYLSCWNQNIGGWASCSAPNLFLASRKDPTTNQVVPSFDQIKVGVHLNLDDKSVCLKRTITPAIPTLGNLDSIRQLPANNPGQLIVPDILGTVDNTLFTGSVSSSYVIVDSATSNPGCEVQDKGSSGNVQNTGNYQIQFVLQQDETFKVKTVNAQVSAPYNDIDNGIVKLNARDTFTKDDINRMQFVLGGHIIGGVLNKLSTARDFSKNNRNSCNFQITSQQASGQSINSREIRVRYELLELDAGGGCSTANRPVGGTQGRTSILIPITVQKEAIGVTQLTGIAQSFAAKNYDQTILAAKDSLANPTGNIDNALALYYYAASLILKGQQQNNPNIFENEIKHILTLFFKRQSGNDRLPFYDNDLIGKSEFQKTIAYMCQIDARYGGEHQNFQTSNNQQAWCQVYGK